MRHGRNIVAVDQVVDDARMIRLLRPGTLKDCRRLPEVRVGLVGGRPRRNKYKRVEYGCFFVCRKALVHLFHAVAVCERARSMVVLIAVTVEPCDCLQVGLLAIRRGRRSEPLLDGLKAGFQRRRAWRIPQRVPLTHGGAPVCHRATGLRVGDRRELLQRLLVPKRMQGPDGVVETALTLGRARDGEVYLAHLRAPGGVRSAMVVGRKSGPKEQGESGKGD